MIILRIGRSVIIDANTYLKEGMRASNLVEYKNERYLDLTLDLVKSYDDIIVCGRDYNILEKYKKFNMKDLDTRLILNLYEGLKRIKNSKALLISINMPLLEKRLLEHMGRITFSEDILIAFANRKIQKLCAVYDKSIITYLEKMIDEKNMNFNRLLDEVSVRYIFPDREESFISVELLEKYLILKEKELYNKI